MQHDDPSDTQAPPDHEDDDLTGEETRVENATRWRLILGQFADDTLGYNQLYNTYAGQSEHLRNLLHEAQDLDTPLSYIYDREYAARSHRQSGLGGGKQLSVPVWLSQVRSLFPKSASHILEQDALTRYGLTELITDPEILRQSEPTEELLKAIIQFKHLMKGDVLEAAREIVRAVVDSLRERLMTECRPALHGAKSANPDTPPIRSARNLDFKRTIQRNLKNYDPQRESLVVERLFFQHRQRNRQSWDIIVAVDQSGSMTDSLIHSAIMAAIFTTLPSVRVHLVLWDHRFFDVSDLAHDPMEVLMACQLGGGTQMLPPMQYCAQLIRNPERTIFTLLSDWYIFDDAAACLALAHELHEAGVTCIGLNALDMDCNPIYDERFARKLAGCGWNVATMTPRELAHFVSKIVQS